MNKPPNTKKMGVKIIWTSQMLTELGTIKDSEFSIKYGMSEKTITRFRRDNNLVTKYAKYIPGRFLTWTDEMLADLKLLHDNEIADKYEISVQAVRARRKLDGIVGIKLPSGFKAVDQRDWPDNKIRIFECLNNDEISDLLDMPINIVRSHRKQLGIPLPVKNIANMFNVEAHLLRKDAQQAKIKLLERASDIIGRMRMGEDPKTIAPSWNISIDRVFRIYENKENYKLNVNTDESGQSVLEQSVEILGMNPKINNILLMNGIQTIGELTALKKTELLKMINLGRRYAVEIMLALEKHHLALS